MTPLQQFELCASTAGGFPISHVWRGYGSAVSIELGALRAKSKRDGTPLQPEGEVSLGIEWSWRIEDRNAILCGSWSEEERWEPAFNLLRNAKLAKLELFGALPEVMLTTDTGLRLISFSTTDGQPQWTLVDHRDGPSQWFTVRNGELHLGDGTEPYE